MDDPHRHHHYHLDIGDLSEDILVQYIQSDDLNSCFAIEYR
jgi:hypothetical protein